ncbi:MAG: hypothetical protein LBR36_03585 [Bacteroidales bacterium]|jgi:hypothetical protein|nr:hypothetical protein [Bacteroidales bacterium]
MNTKKSLTIGIVLHFMLCNTYGQISTKELPVSFGIQNLSARSVLSVANVMVKE